jgi:hypothetical protein
MLQMHEINYTGAEAVGNSRLVGKPELIQLAE